MELKGIIKIGESKWLTCCNSIIDIIIGEESLFDALEKQFNQDSDEYFESNPEKQSPTYTVRFVVLDQPPTEERSIDSLAAQIIVEQMVADYTSGCYSEYTCGTGGFDYVVSGSRSIFNELSGFEGKYIHFQI